MPTLEQFERYRYYACFPSLHGYNSAYKCYRMYDSNFDKDDLLKDEILKSKDQGLGISRIMIINKYVPHIFDGLVLKYELIPKIKVE